MITVTEQSAKVIKRASGKLVTRGWYRNDYGQEKLGVMTPRWAYHVIAIAGLGLRPHGRFIRLLRHAANNVDVRDAVIAALEVGPELVKQLAKAQGC